MATLTEGLNPAHFLIAEANAYRSRDQVILANATVALVTMAAGLVLARREFGTLTAARTAGGGDGAITALSLGAQARVGTYTLRNIAVAANGGTFAVFAPDGARLPDLAVGVAYTSPQINLTVADGAADWNAAAVIEVVVPAGDGQFVPFTNANGLPAAGILLERAAVPASGTARAVAVRRDAEINVAALQFDASLSGGALTAAQTAARASLLALGIVGR